MREAFADLRELFSTDALLRWPAFLVRFERLRLRQLARSPRGPAALMIWTNLFWLVPIFIYSQYLQKFQVAVALSNVQVGYCAAIATATGVVFWLVGGWLTDRLGYKRTVLIFDALSWPAPMLLLSVATRPGHFYAASLLVGTMSAVAPAGHALFVSRVPPERRAAAYGMHALVSTAPAILLPLLGGWLVERFGLELSMRWLYRATAALTAAGILIRGLLIPATPPLRAAIPGLLESLADQFRIYARFALRPEMRAFFLGLAFMNMFLPVSASFISLYCMDYLGLSEINWAWLTAIAGLAQLPATLLLSPLINSRTARRFYLLIIGALMAAGILYLALLVRPRLAVPLMPVLVAATVLSAAGLALWNPAVLSQWANEIPEEIRSRLWGAHGAFNGLLAAGAVAAVGHLYELWRPALIVVGLALQAAAAACFALSPVGAARLAAEAKS